MPSLTVMRMLVHSPTAVGVPLSTPVDVEKRRPRRPVLDRVAQRRALGIVTLRTEVILRAHVHPAGGRAGNGGRAGWQSGPGPASSCRRRGRTARRSASAGAARRKHSTEACGLSGRSKLPWPSSRHARACCEHSCLAREVERRESVRPASRERSAREQSAAATPLSVSAADQRVRGPEALRHRLSTVLPLVRRCAVCRAARNVTYRAGPHRRRADSGKAN